MAIIEAHALDALADKLEYSCNVLAHQSNGDFTDRDFRIAANALRYSAKHARTSATVTAAALLAGEQEFDGMRLAAFVRGLQGMVDAHQAGRTPLGAVVMRLTQDLSNKDRARKKS